MAAVDRMSRRRASLLLARLVDPPYDNLMVADE